MAGRVEPNEGKIEAASSPTRSPMTINTSRWHDLVQSRDVKGWLRCWRQLRLPFAGRAPPQVGKAVTLQYLSAPFSVLQSVVPVRSRGHRRNDAVLEFQVEIDGIAVNGWT